MPSGRRPERVADSAGLCRHQSLPLGLSNCVAQDFGAARRGFRVVALSGARNFGRVRDGAVELREGPLVCEGSAPAAKCAAGRTLTNAIPGNLLLSPLHGSESGGSLSHPQAPGAVEYSSPPWRGLPLFSGVEALLATAAAEGGSRSAARCRRGPTRPRPHRAPTGWPRSRCTAAVFSEGCEARTPGASSLGCSARGRTVPSVRRSV